MTDAMHIVLIVEDDPALCSIQRIIFEANRFRVVIVGTAREGEHAALLHRPDVVLVDLGLPDRDGITVIRSIRRWSAMPIIVLSARAEEEQRIEAFDAGADDYVMKPFSPPELLARVRALLRRHARGDLPMGVLQLGAVVVDLGRRVATRGAGSEVRLTPLEHRILETLARHRERVVTYSVLMREVWGPHDTDFGKLRVYIGSLRRKLEPDPGSPRFIVTELAVGYRLVMDSDVEETAR